MVDTCGPYQMVKSSGFELITCKLFDGEDYTCTYLGIKCLFTFKRFDKVDYLEMLPKLSKLMILPRPTSSTKSHHLIVVHFQC